MARIAVFQPSIEQAAPGVTAFRAPDFGPGIGAGVERLGEGLSQAAHGINEIQDVSAHNHANHAMLAYNTLAQQQDHIVRSAMGEGAEAVADKAGKDLQAETQKLLAGLDPRARKIAEPQLAERMLGQNGDWWNHAFEEKKKGLSSSTAALNESDLQAAGRTPDDAAAAPIMAGIAARTRTLHKFLGKSEAETNLEIFKTVSAYHTGRAQAAGAQDAGAGLKYATDHRAQLTDEDFHALERTYENEALKDQVVRESYALQHGGTVSGSGEVTPGTDSTSETTTGAATGADPKAPAKPAKGHPKADEAKLIAGDPSALFARMIVPNEGSKFVERDSNGYPVKYGINGKWHPGVDIKNLTYAQAQKIFIKDYWEKAGCDKLSPALAIVHADTFYLNEKEATRILRECGGDVDKYMELRNNFLAQIHAKDPAKYPNYASRNKRVANMAGAAPHDGTPLSIDPITPRTPMNAIIDKVMARTDMTIKHKTALIEQLRKERSDQRDEERVTQETAHDNLTRQTTALGENFTSIKQLDPNDIRNASPDDVAGLTRQARVAKYRENDAKLEPTTLTERYTNEDHFMSKDYIRELQHAGASPELIKKVQDEQGKVLETRLNAKTNVPDSKQIWSVLKEPFTAAGLNYDKAPPRDKKISGVLKPADAARGEQVRAQGKMEAIAFVHRQATLWAQQNPGKKPDEQTIRGWGAEALLKVKSGRPYYLANNQHIYESLGEAYRARIERDLRANGDKSTGHQFIDHVVTYHLERMALGQPGG